MADILTEEDLVKSALYEAVRDKVFNAGMTLTLDSPITDEQWEIISDVDFDNTERVWFNTKTGKRAEFVKQKHGEWIFCGTLLEMNKQMCSECGTIAFRKTD